MPTAWRPWSRRAAMLSHWRFPELVRGRCAFLCPRRLDKMQGAREQSVRLAGAADMDDAGALSSLAKTSTTSSRTSSSSKPNVPSMSTQGGIWIRMRAKARHSCSS